MTDDEVPRTRIVPGRIRQGDVTVRILLPSSRVPEFEPYRRLAESIGTSRRTPPLHAHQDEEVLLVVLEGSLEHVAGEGVPSQLDQGSVLVATAGPELRHALRISAGRTAHWFSVVMATDTAPPASVVTVGSPGAGSILPGPEGAIARPLVGPGGPGRSSVGSVLTEIRFVKSGTLFLPVGRGRRGFVYVLNGDGRVHDLSVSAGQGALLDPQAGVAVYGETGFHALFGSAPVPKSFASPPAAGSPAVADRGPGPGPGAP